ncbi:MAG: DUF2800 domain-containing protein [Chthoniobacterales bacterium]|nr:DUF2800 domain-containing protein [Chthoniobacterales bacterium]
MPCLSRRRQCRAAICEYCARQATCPALASKALSAAAELVDGLPLPTSMLVDESRPDDVPKILRLAPIFKEWGETAKKEALRLNLEEGLEFDGFERRERKNPRGVTSVPRRFLARVWNDFHP